MNKVYEVSVKVANTNEIEEHEIEAKDIVALEKKIRRIYKKTISISPLSVWGSEVILKVEFPEEVR
jgi:hypothetical protein